MRRDNLELMARMVKHAFRHVLLPNPYIYKEEGEECQCQDKNEKQIIPSSSSESPSNSTLLLSNGAAPLRIAAVLVLLCPNDDDEIGETKQAEADAAADGKQQVRNGNVDDTAAVCEELQTQNYTMNSPPQHCCFSLLLTVRSRHLRRHPGEVCFPGGMRDRGMGDRTPVDTALREAYEEIGLPPSFVRIVCTLRPMASMQRVKIFPVLALMEPALRRQFRPTFSEEVQSHFWAKLERFLSANDGQQSVAIPGHQPTMHLFMFNYQQLIVFGITATICLAVAIGVLNRLPEFACLPMHCNGNSERSNEWMRSDTKEEDVIAFLSALFDHRSQGVASSSAPSSSDEPATTQNNKISIRAKI